MVHIEAPDLDKRMLARSLLPGVFDEYGVKRKRDALLLSSGRRIGSGSQGPGKRLHFDFLKFNDQEGDPVRITRFADANNGPGNVFLLHAGEEQVGRALVDILRN